MTVDGASAGKSDRVLAGAWLEVELPPAPSAVPSVAEPVAGLRVVYDDDDVIVVDKPVGVAAHQPRLGVRPSWEAWRVRATASLPAGPPSGRASCTAWMSEPAA